MLLEQLTGFIKVKYIAVLAAVAAVAILGYLWLAPSGQQRQEKVARQQLLGNECSRFKPPVPP